MPASILLLWKVLHVRAQQRIIVYLVLILLKLYLENNFILFIWVNKIHKYAIYLRLKYVDQQVDEKQNV